jgi:MFS family permease
MNPGRILTTTCIITFVMMLGIGIVIPLLPAYAQSMGATATQIGLIFSCFAIARAICNPIAGALADRTDMKPILLSGIVVYGLLSFAYVFSTEPIHLIIIRTLHGMASAFVIPIAMTYAALLANQGEEGIFMGYINMALFFGMGSGPLIGGFLTDEFGINTSFYMLAGLSGISAVTSFIFLPSMKKNYQNKPKGVFFSIIKDRIMLGLLLFRIINALGSGSLMAFVPLLAKGYGLSSTSVGILISANILLTGILQRPIGGYTKRDNCFVFLITGSIISAVALMSLPFGNGLAAYFIMSCIMGFGSALSMPAASVLMVEHGRDVGMSSTMGIFDSAFSIGMIIGPVMSGIIMDMFGISWVFYLGGMICLTGTAVFWIITRKKTWQVHPG